MSKRCADFEKHELKVMDGLTLDLHHHRARGERTATALLLHGGNTSSGLFREPDGGLARFLTEAGVDVWTLDWRASATILGRLLKTAPLGGSVAAERALLSPDEVATKDIPLALKMMDSLGVRGDVSVLGFCLGGGSLSISIARGALENLGKIRVSNVLLVTMGLFYEVPWDGWVKAEDFILERMLSTAPTFRAVDAAEPADWPSELQRAYERWPKSWLGAKRGPRALDRLFERLTFMYGEPYARPRLDRKFERKLTKPGYFGPLHMGLYLHGSQMVRRGYAAKLDELDIIDRSRLDARKASCRRAGDRRQQALRESAPSVVGDLLPKNFRNKRVTLFAGADDRLWHRDSIDLMYEWLRNEATPPGERERHRKHVLPLYGHLDLFWSPDSPKDVFPKMLEAIKQPPLEAQGRAGAAGAPLPCLASSLPTAAQ
jgi:hypothetical protein